MHVTLWQLVTFVNIYFEGTWATIHLIGWISSYGFHRHRIWWHCESFPCTPFTLEFSVWFPHYKAINPCSVWQKDGEHATARVDPWFFVWPRQINDCVSTSLSWILYQLISPYIMDDDNSIWTMLTEFLEFVLNCKYLCISTRWYLFSWYIRWCTESSDIWS